MTALLPADLVNEVPTTEYPEPNFGPTGKVVYERTYQRTKANGTKETWLDTVNRVVNGNLALVDPKYIEEGEREALINLIYSFKLIPAGRHLWASGVGGREFLFNCHVAGWNAYPENHFEFTFMRLMEGGGVGSNYSSKYLDQYPELRSDSAVSIVCDPEHQDYADMNNAQLLINFVDDDATVIKVADSREGWANALSYLIGSFYHASNHTNIVFDVSEVRPAGSELKTFGGTSSGPLPFAKMILHVAEVLNARGIGNKLTSMDAMEIDHYIAECVVSGGVRRSARMSMLLWNDPDIFNFIHCKETSGKFWTTNISVEVDENFFAALNVGDAHARRVLDEVSVGMLHNGEPGFWNSEYSNQGEPNKVIATNPCGEIALESWENCNLGHVNLDALADASFDEIQEAHRLMARFLLRATFGDVSDPKQREVLNRNRRIGVGHLGVQGFIVKKGVKYSEAPDHWDFRQGLTRLRETVRKTVREYAFELRIPEPVKCTTVAPTGSIAKMPGVTEGIHPVLFRYFIRRVRFSNIGDADKIAEFKAQGYYTEPCKYAPMTTVVEFPTKEKLVDEVESLGLDPSIVETASELTIEQLLAFQAMYQECYADNAVSFTVNVSADTHTPEDLSAILEEYLPRLKGTTIMVESSHQQAPYEAISQADYELSMLVTVGDSLDDCRTGACPVK